MERRYSCAQSAELAGSSIGLPILQRENRCASRSKPEIDHRRRVERQHLADQQSADDGDAQRTAQLRARARAEASGKPPSSAAMVVIMIGRKRSRQA